MALALFLDSYLYFAALGVIKYGLGANHTPPPLQVCCLLLRTWVRKPTALPTRTKKTIKRHDVIIYLTMFHWGVRIVPFISITATRITITSLNQKRQIIRLTSKEHHIDISHTHKAWILYYKDEVCRLPDIVLYSNTATCKTRQDTSAIHCTFLWLLSLLVCHCPCFCHQISLFPLLHSNRNTKLRSL